MDNLKYMVCVNTLAPRPADDYDLLCYKLAARNPAISRAAEREIIEQSRRLGLDLREAIDNAWSHGRNLRAGMMQVAR